MPVPLSVSEAKRVSAPMRSAANWSSEMVFLKLGAPGCGAAVRNEYSAECPPSTAGCDSPEKISSATADNDWAYAKAWLRLQLGR